MEHWIPNLEQFTTKLKFYVSAYTLPLQWSRSRKNDHRCRNSGMLRTRHLFPDTVRKTQILHLVGHFGAAWCNLNFIALAQPGSKIWSCTAVAPPVQVCTRFLSGIANVSVCTGPNVSLASFHAVNFCPPSTTVLPSISLTCRSHNGRYCIHCWENPPSASTKHVSRSKQRPPRNASRNWRSTSSYNV